MVRRHCLSTPLGSMRAARSVGHTIEAKPTPPMTTTTAASVSGSRALTLNSIDERTRVLAKAPANPMTIPRKTETAPRA